MRPGPYGLGGMPRALVAAAAVAAQGAFASGCSVPHYSNPNYLLEGADFQYKLTRYFEGTGTPPLEEVFFATQNLTQATEAVLQRDCPGLLISAFIVLAEARLPVAPLEAANALAKADQLALELSEEDYKAAAEIWPVGAALASYHAAERAIGDAKRDAAGTLPVVQVVVCHCRESLEWLTDGHLHIPAEGHVRMELFVYEKYLRHLVDQYRQPPDFALFFQADAGDHMQWGYLSLVMHAIERHSLRAEFVHLNHPRLVASLSPCREEVFRRLFDRPPHQILGSYCCAQFLVAKSRWLATPLERYERMQRMLFEDSPPECHDIEGHSTQCLMYEIYWHILFGEPDELPERADNTALPLMLRTRDLENESYLPPGSLFLKLAMDV